jgi:hypothetical protein
MEPRETRVCDAGGPYTHSQERCCSYSGSGGSRITPVPAVAPESPRAPGRPRSSARRLRAGGARPVFEKVVPPGVRPPAIPMWFGVMSSTCPMPCPASAAESPALFTRLRAGSEGVTPQPVLRHGVPRPYTTLYSSRSVRPEGTAGCTSLPRRPVTQFRDGGRTVGRLAASGTGACTTEGP